MKRFILGCLTVSILISKPVTIYGATTKIEVDGVAVVSDIAPETKDNRTMVPLRVISENLGAKVDWTHNQVTLFKGDTQVVLKTGSKEFLKNGEIVLLDSKTYVQNNRTMVPLRFIAEVFSCKVDYKDQMVRIATEPLMINGRKVEILSHEYYHPMYPTGSISEMQVNIYNKAIYDVFIENKGSKSEAPIKYDWKPDVDTKGAYYQVAQYHFKDINYEDIQQFNVYFPVSIYSEKDSQDYPSALLYDVTMDQWHVFNEAAVELFTQILEKAGGYFELKDLI